MTQFWSPGDLRELTNTLPGGLDVDDRMLAEVSGFNVCPSQSVPVIYADRMKPRLTSARWGITRTDAGGSLVSNARSETIDTTPMFRDAFESSRCLIPARGFYEWERSPDGGKQPWYFSAADAAPFYLAAVLCADSGEPAIANLTADTPPEAHTRIHRRMPVIVPVELAGVWLGLESMQGIGPRSALRVFGARHAFPFRAHPVSRRVNSVGNDDPELIEPIEPEPGLFG